MVISKRKNNPVIHVFHLLISLDGSHVAGATDHLMVNVQRLVCRNGVQEMEQQKLSTMKF